MSGGSGGGGGEWRPPATPTPKSGADKDGGGGKPPKDPCNIIETTTLNSPVAAVIATLRAGDLLAVVFQPGPPQRLVAEQSPGVIAGSITSPSMLQIIQCIRNEGVEYQAEVISVKGAICQIRIQPK